MPGGTQKARKQAVETFVSLIRGINVAGHRPVKMARLVELCEGLGYSNPRTYLQSGNVVFKSGRGPNRAVGDALERLILRECGLEVSVAVRTSREMTAALAANPLASRPGVDTRFLHATFLVGQDGRASLDGVALPLARGEEAVLVGIVVYVYCPNGYGVTKINNTFFERKLGARATTRNWNTVTALERMARGGPRDEP